MVINSIYTFLNVKENAVLQKCWIAATNKKAFENLKSENIEDIAVQNLCEQIWQNYYDYDYNSMKINGLSLSSAGILMFGTVLIFKSQIDFLYAKTKILYNQKEALFKSCGIRNKDIMNCSGTYHGLKSFTENSTFSPTYFDDLLRETEENEKIIESNFLIFNENINYSRNEDISLKEIATEELWEKHFEENEEDFLGQISENEINFLSQILTQKQNLFDLEASIKSNSYCAHMEVDDLIQSAANDLNNTHSKLINGTIVEENIAELSNGWDNINDFEIEKCTKKTRKRKHLQIDHCTKLNSSSMVKRSFLLDTIRCTHPRDDIVQHPRIIPAEKLLSTCGPSSRINNLLLNFPRKLKRKIERSARNEILFEILGTNLYKSTTIDREQFLNCPLKKRKIIHMNNKSTNAKKIEDLNLMEINPLYENISLSATSSKQHLNILEQIMKEFPIDLLNNKSNKEIECNNDLNVKRQIINGFNVLTIIKKLLKLWDQHIYPINMPILFEPDLANKLGAAKGFTSILELNAKQYIKIVKDDITHNIIHIEPGEIIRSSFIIIEKK